MKEMAHKVKERHKPVKIVPAQLLLYATEILPVWSDDVCTSLLRKNAGMSFV